MAEPSTAIIRSFQPDDSFEALTELLHAAYASLSDAGMKYLASHQDVATTRRRAESGDCFVSEVMGTIVGTITLYPPSDGGLCAYYTQPGVWHFGQFAVKPELQGAGIGDQLLRYVEQKAKLCGAREIALDTSKNADSLISWYTKRGYQPVGIMDWDVTNYISVILSKRLDD